MTNITKRGAFALTVGIGARRGVPAEDVLALVDDVLRAGHLRREDVSCLATLAARAAEPGLLAAAARLGVPLVGHPAAALAAVPVPHPSDAVRDAVGTASVAEAAALVAGGELLVGKRTSQARTVTCAVARTRPWAASGRNPVDGGGAGAWTERECEE